MKSSHLNPILLSLFVLTVTVLYSLSVKAVPFHPDESTQIYMSMDADLLRGDPSALFWKAGQDEEIHQHYRLMDAPLTRYLIGAGRLLSGLPASAADWNWSLSWNENARSGALPDNKVLIAARLSVAWLFPLTLLMIYAAGSHIGGKSTGWLAMLLLASNALILLHTRRAMAESALVFTTVFTLWALVCASHRPWLVALPVALAFNAKQLTLALLIPGLLAVLWRSDEIKIPFARRLRDLLLFGLMFVGITFVLNPFLWSDPLQAASAAWQARAEFTRQQVELVHELGNALPNSTLERAGSILYQLFIAGPAVVDTENYLDQIRPAAEVYLANPFNNLLRGITSGIGLMVLSILGMIVASWKANRAVESKEHKRAFGLLVTASLVQFAALALAVPIPFQRYYLVLVPYACLWTAFALSQIIQPVLLRFNAIKKPAGGVLRQEKIESS